MKKSPYARHRFPAAKSNCFKKLLKKRFTPRVIISDKLKSYGAAFKERQLKIEHRQHQGLNH